MKIVNPKVGNVYILQETAEISLGDNRTIQLSPDEQLICRGQWFDIKDRLLYVQIPVDSIDVDKLVLYKESAMNKYLRVRREKLAASAMESLLSNNDFVGLVSTNLTENDIPECDMNKAFCKIIAELAVTQADCLLQKLEETDK